MLKADLKRTHLPLQASAAERIFGYAAAEMIGQLPGLIIPRDRLEEEEAILARLRSGDRVDPFETVRKRKDGTEIRVAVSAGPVTERTA